MRRFFLKLAHGLLLGACSGPPQQSESLVCAAPEKPIQRITARITAGSSTSLIGLTDAEANAVVLVNATADNGFATCSGSVIHETWVLTARHCVDGLSAPELEVVVGSTEREALHRAAVESLNPHTELDLLALRLERPLPSSLVRPLRVSRAAQGVEVGVIAGFGVTAELELGRRLFAVADVSLSDSRYYTTSAAPLSGACIGDSGGPLLWRDDVGAPLLLGVLSNGSASCRGDDRYTRVEQASEWLKALVAIALEPPGCEELGARGMCVSEKLAVWCDSGDSADLATQECSETERCGWQPELRGFRCVDPADDPCQGYSHFGVCQAGVAHLCDGGELQRRSCCNDACARSPQDGRVACIE